MKVSKGDMTSLSVSVVIPVLNEQDTLPLLLRHLSSCTPPPSEIIVSDGGSSDGTVDVARKAEVVVVESKAASGTRALSLNRGLAAATSDLVVFVHADTFPPADFVSHIQNTMADVRVSLGAFRAIIASSHDVSSGKMVVNRIITAHHYIKTYYGPLFLYPYQMLVLGLRSFFGDQCMFGRRQQLLEVAGFDNVPIMEESTLCKKMVRYGRQVLLSATCTTLDRRIALYGTLRITLLHLFIGFGAELGIPLSWLSPLYPPQHELEERQRLAKIRSHIRGNRFFETNFIWNEVVNEKCYHHDRVKIPSVGATVIDVGANIGIFSLWTANCCQLKGATIHAIEPSPSTFKLLEANATEPSVEAISGNRIVTHNLAMTSSQQSEQRSTMPLTTYPNCSGWATFHQDEETLREDLWCFVSNSIGAGIGNNFMIKRVVLPILKALVYPFAFKVLTLGAARSNVQVACLSSFMKENSIDLVDFLKIDVERHEYQVLLGISDNDWPRIEAVAVETEVNHAAIRELLETHHFLVEEKKEQRLQGAPHTIIWGMRVPKMD